MIICNAISKSNHRIRGNTLISINSKNAGNKVCRGHDVLQYYSSTVAIILLQQDCRETAALVGPNFIVTVRRQKCYKYNIALLAKYARSPVTFTTFAVNSARSPTRSLVHRVNLARRKFSKEKKSVRGDRCKPCERVRRERAEFASNSARTPSSYAHSKDYTTTLFQTLVHFTDNPWLMIKRATYSSTLQCLT